MTYAERLIEIKLLLYKLFQNGISGDLYENFNTIYSEYTCCVQVNGLVHNQEWRQAGCIYNTLFDILINGIVYEVNNLNLGIIIRNRKLSDLLYTDDIVLLNDTDEGLQTMLNTAYAWDMRNMIKYNGKKSKIEHYRNLSIPQTNTTFCLGDNYLSVVKQYIYYIW